MLLSSSARSMLGKCSNWQKGRRGGGKEIGYSRALNTLQPHVLRKITRKVTTGFMGREEFFHFPKEAEGQMVFQHAYITGSTMRDKKIYQDRDRREIETGKKYPRSQHRRLSRQLCLLFLSFCLLPIIPVKKKTWSSHHLRFIRFLHC